MSFFVLNMNQKEYILKTKGRYINKDTNFEEINSFYLYDKNLYEERKSKIEKDKKEGNYFPSLYSNKLPRTMLFTVISKETNIVKDFEAQLENIVNFKWVEDNSWKENNPNVLFKDLYFLIKIGKNRYYKYKVRKTPFVQ